MKVIVWTKYGPPDGLQLKEVEKPILKDNEVLTLTISDMTGIQTTNWLMKTAYSHSPILQLPGPAH